MLVYIYTEANAVVLTLKRELYALKTLLLYSI